MSLNICEAKFLQEKIWTFCHSVLFLSKSNEFWSGICLRQDLNWPRDVEAYSDAISELHTVETATAN